MEEQLISKETAILAKEKGFDLYNHLKNGNPPTQSVLQKWLREEHKIYIMVYVMEDSDGIIYHEFGLKQVVNWLSDKSCKPAKFNTYEDALEFGLQKALTFVL